MGVFPYHPEDDRSMDKRINAFSKEAVRNLSENFPGILGALPADHEPQERKESFVQTLQQHEKRMTVMPSRDLAGTLGAAMRKTVAIPLVK